jgi:CarD family transcriptional regulator
MYQIGDKAIDRLGHIFEVVAVVQKDFGSGLADYLVMRPCFDYDFNEGYCSYVPKERAEGILRPIMTKDEALTLIDSLEGLKCYPEVNPRERKIFFTKIVSNGDRTEICRVIKTLSNYRDSRLKMKKPFSDFDKELLENLTDLFDNEVSLALGILPSDVSGFIQNRMNS